MSEAALPKSWADAVNNILANAPWILLLIALERAFELHYIEAAIAFLLCIVVFGIAIHWNVFEGLTKPEGRKRLAFMFIAGGTTLLAIGIWLLARSPQHAEKSSAGPSVAAIEAQQDLERQLASTRSELQDVQRQLTSARTVPVDAPPRLGPDTTIKIIKELAMPPLIVRSEPPPPTHWAVLITAPSENARLAETLFQLLYMAMQNKVKLLAVPDRSKQLDAPILPDSGVSGIILHGQNWLNARLEQTLKGCFDIRQTDEVPDGLNSEFFKIPAEFKVVWIEIGKGSPYKEPFESAK
jgi:hypothetical protein